MVVGPKARAKARENHANRARIVLGVVDGTRRSIGPKVELLIRITDGFQNQRYRNFRQGPVHNFAVPFFDNLQDNYTVLVSAKGHVDAGFTPVKVSTLQQANVDLMLLPKKSTFKFQDWGTLKQAHPEIWKFLCCGASEADAKQRYEEVRKNKPSSLAALLNLATAMNQIQLPSKTPLDYYTELLWDESMAQDRFFGYAAEALLGQVKTASRQGVFRPEPSPGLFHPGATSSYKQVQFGEANVQLTFHEKDTKTVNGIKSNKVEADIDYYQDVGAHALLEVIPNTLSHGLTDPRMTYVLRWIAGRQAGIPEFDPPYTIEA